LDNAPIVVEVREHKNKVDDAIARLKELDVVLKDSKSRKEALLAIRTHTDDLENNLSCIKEMVLSLPDEIEYMLKTLEEMKNGSTPDAKADYFEMKQQID